VAQRDLPFGFGLTTLAFNGNRIALAAPFQFGATGIHPARSVGTQAEILGGVFVFGEAESGWGLVAQLGPSQVQAGSGVAQRGYLGLTFALDGENIAAMGTNELTGTDPGFYVFGPDCAQIPAAASVPGC
jgi:hypothetical protein